MFATRFSGGILALLLWTICDTHTVVVQAQSNGTCVCQPGEITFTLNFDLGCVNQTIMTGQPGINETLCVVTPITADIVPISVSTITVSEFGHDDLDPLKMENYTGTFLSGDTFTYSAFSTTNSDMVMNGTIPNVLQVAITGVNANNEVIINNFVIVFTNDCTIYPVLDVDSTIGWVSLTTVTGPPAEFCPAFTPESDVPSSFPSSIPSLAPTRDEYCNCQAGTLTLIVDYELTCGGSTIMTGDRGIEEAQCMVFSNADLMVSDPVPVTVTAVLIYELDANLDIIKSTEFNSTFESGDTLVYESFAATDTDAVSAGLIPRALQVTLNGFNAAGDDLSNSYVIFYTNECDVYPVLTSGSTIGWTSLFMVTGPPAGLCPAFDSESTVPSIVPSSVPIAVSTLPSIVPSSVPVAIESTLPSIVPSNVPVAIESTLPSIVPSSVPVAIESTLPSIVPSSVPVAIESTLPSMVPSNVPIESTLPSIVPSIVPSSVPTESALPSVVPSGVPVMLETDTPVAPPSTVVPPVMAPVAPPTDVTAPTCAPIGKGGKGGKGKGGKGKGDSERLLRTGGGGAECPEPNEPKMKKTKTKDNMSMDIEKKKGMKMSKVEKGKVTTAAPKSAPAAPVSKAMSKESKDGTSSKGKGKVGDDSSKGKMGMGMGKEKAKEPKGEKASKKKAMEKPVKKEKLDEADKKGKMEDSERRQLRSLLQ